MNKRSYSFLKIHSGSDLSLRRLPYMSITSNQPGPVIWLTACIHGDEVGGIVVVQEVFKLLKSRLISGSIHAFPLMNPIGFETSSRKITVSDEDLNRSFPGDENGSLGKRIANRILQRILATKPELVLDLHNDWVKSIPYVVLDKPENIKNNAFEKASNIAQKTGFIVVAENDNIPGSLSYNLLDAGIPALTMELGESYVINENNVQIGVAGILKVLELMGMISGTSSQLPDSYPAVKDSQTLIYKYYGKPYASQSGIVRFLVKLGSHVKKGQALAKIVNAFGKQKEIIRAEKSGIILGYTDSVVIFPGMPVIAMAITES